jgi:hypothetical protein
MMHPAEGGPSPLDPDTTAEMLALQVRVNDRPPWRENWPNGPVTLNDCVGWGLGWGIQRTPEGDAFWHWGDNGCYRAFAIGSPESGNGMVVLTNSENGQRVIRTILRDLIGGDYPALDWLDGLHEV